MGGNGDFWSMIEAHATIAAGIAAWITAAVAVVGVAYAILQYQQGESARKDARAAEAEAAKERTAAERFRRESLQPYVVASPVPELSHDRDLVLLIKNYGPTAAHDLAVTFLSCRIIVAEERNMLRAASKGQRELPLASTVLAPGQAIQEYVRIFDAPRTDPVVVELEVVYSDSSGATQEHAYTIKYSEAAWLPEPKDPVSQSLRAIAATLKSWTGPDKRSVLAETPKEQHLRVFGLPDGRPDQTGVSGQPPADPDTR